jgi:hypothetical protein
VSFLYPICVNVISSHHVVFKSPFHAQLAIYFIITNVL